MVLSMMNSIKRIYGAKHKTEHPKRSGERLNWRRVAGFTMAELLIVVAILGVLAGVSFIAVQNHQKSVTQLQYDTIAKEIFVAAQNHLTLAKGENYRQNADLDSVPDAFYGNPDGSENDVYYFVSGDPDNVGTLLDQMLPFGAVEVVSGGQYIVRYQPKAAKVLDVFYWTNGSGRFDANIDADSAYSELVSTYRDETKHKQYTSGLLGWCGGEGIVKSGKYLDAPIIEVKNEELLVVYVTDTNASEDKASLKPQLKLIVEGLKSGAKVAIPLKSLKSTRVTSEDEKYVVVLDDITREAMHFADLNSVGTGFVYPEPQISFIPGENITIQAVAYSNDELTSVTYSGEWTTNSLFGEVTETEEDIAEEVHINNIRHLENLNDGVSSVAYENAYFGGAINAVQTADMDWSTFKTGANELKNVASDAVINIFDKSKQKTKDNCFLPVSVNSEYTLSYNGQSQVALPGETEGEDPRVITENHSIKNVAVDNTDAGSSVSLTAGGVFGSLTGATLQNLELIDTSVALASGPAGALVGSLGAGSTVSNVLAHNTEKIDTAKITSASGSAGGLIGSMADTTVEKCAAALVVSGKDNAGGLVGSSDGGSVVGCYAGGHAQGNEKDGNVVGVWYGDASKSGLTCNVTATATATGNAGGLIGDAGDTDISYSYSTCSVSGATAGGFVGKSTGNVKYCYSAGLVTGNTRGAFAGVKTLKATGCRYFEIVNEFADETLGFDYLTPLVKDDESTVSNGLNGGITAIDATAETYNRFCGAPSGWKAAKAYLGKTTEVTTDDWLNIYYDGKYNLQTVAQLLANNSAEGVSLTVVETPDEDNPVADFVATHYGDWPAPEIFVINEKSGS